MATPSDWGFGIPTKPIGNTDLADIYVREGFADLAFIHRLTPDQARSALVFLSGVEPETFTRMMAYLPTRHPEMRASVGDIPPIYHNPAHPRID